MGTIFVATLCKRLLQILPSCVCVGVCVQAGWNIVGLLQGNLVFLLPLLPSPAPDGNEPFLGCLGPALQPLQSAAWLESMKLASRWEESTCAGFVPVSPLTTGPPILLSLNCLCKVQMCDPGMSQKPLALTCLKLLASAS